MGPASAMVCSVCGEALGAKRVCFACLLRAGLDDAEQPDVPEAAALFDDFEIARREDGSLWELGRGAMGVTYRASEKTLHRSVALKVIETHGSEAVRERFLREARAAAALRHPNVAAVFRFGALADVDRCYCAMELVEGETLDALVRREGPLKLETALEIAIQITRALMASAERNLIHRDLKPGNIMLTPSESSPAKIEVKVIDFGLAKAGVNVPGEMELTRGEFVGTPAFASPEQFTGGAIDARTDIYALGVTLWFALSGGLPFAGRTIEEIRQRQTEGRLPMEQLVGVPRRVIELLRSCLAIEPSERPSSARVLMKALESCQAESLRRRRKSRLAILAGIAVLALGMAAILLWRSREHNLVVAPAIAEKSIAVLPFENRSGDLENVFFTDGVQDEILTDLARIAELKVISRTSVMQYKTGIKRNLRQVATELGVAHVVEGSVQRAGNRIRVNAQLIDARTDTHLWAQTYDRDLVDVFAIQSEIAKAIAEQLQAKLSPKEKSEIEQPPTSDVTAFDFYSHAKNLLLNASGSSTGKTDLLQAADLLNQAVARDPAFFEAHCQLAFNHASLYFFDFDRTPSRLAAAEGAVQTAARLRPDAGETHLARARNLYWGHSDYDGALAELEIARQRLPSDNWVFSLKGYIERRQGRWDDSLRDLEQAIALDPRNILTLQQTARSYTMLHRYAESKSLLARVLSFEPNDPVTRVLHAFVELDSNANARPVREVIDSIRRTNPVALPNVANNWLLCALAERDVAAARLALAACGENPILLSSNENVIFPHSFAEGLIARMNHDDDKARAAFAEAHAEQEKIVQARGAYGPALCVLGLIDAALGRKEQALREGWRAVELVRAEKDAVVGPTTIKYLAIIAAWVDDKDLACNQLGMLTRDPSGVSYGQLKLMPFWDPLRGDPRFEKIVGEAEGAVTPLADATSAPEKSIAVLPFESLSEEKANEYFAAGVQDEILTRLAAVRDLKVISRTSTTKYKSKPDNLKKVALELGVSTILEGSVQKAGDKVRINVQLIDARTDTHLWAKTYDRDLKDVFAVESEVSQEIADTLRVKLSATQSATMANAPTNDTEAYDLFLRGEYEFHQAGISLDAGAAADRADAFYRRALARDPNFVGPAVELARSRLYRHWYVSPLGPAELEEVKSIIDRTLARAPDSPEAHLALGLFFYWGHRQYEMALAEFKRTLELRPNNADAQAYCAWIYRRRGEWERSLADSQRAQELAPRDASVPQNIGLTYLALRRWKEAEAAEFRALALDPQNTVAAVLLVNCRLSGTGDANSARGALDDFPEALKSLTTTLYSRRGVSSGGEVAAITGIWAYLDVIQRRFTDAFQVFEKEAGNDDRGNLELLAGRVALRVLAGQAEAAKSMGEEALPSLEARLRERPDDTFAMTELSWVYLALGRNGDALRLSQQAADSISIEKDALDGPVFQTGLAQIEARAGSPGEAIKRLRRLLSIPAGQRISVARLKNDPVWDPIRQLPDFQQLLSGPEQIGPNK